MMHRLAAALNDIEESFAVAIRKAASPSVARRLAELREQTAERVRRAAAGPARQAAHGIGAA